MKYVPKPSVDAGLLALRSGTAICCVLLFALQQSKADEVFAGQSMRPMLIGLMMIGTVLVACGLLTRISSAALAACWLVAMFVGLQLGEKAFVQPMRSGLFSALFVVLAIMGPGRFSLDSMIDSRAEKSSDL